MLGLMRSVSLLVLLAGCRDKSLPPPAVAELRFPVVVIYGKSSAVLFPDSAALGSASIASLNATTGPPPLIDSDFKIYTLRDFGSTHSGLWLMANPTGSSPVTFKLERARQSGIATARKLIQTRLDAQTWRDDLLERRKALSQEQTLAGMMAIVEGRAD
jgi:hypothetical protein